MRWEVNGNNYGVVCELEDLLLDIMMGRGCMPAEEAKLILERTLIPIFPPDPIVVIEENFEIEHEDLIEDFITGRRDTLEM